MKLYRLRISNFQSFGTGIAEITLDDLTFLIGPNGAGKTAVLQALCRLFAFDPSLRRIHRSDFHVPLKETPGMAPEERTFWLEVEFVFPELNEADGEYATIPPNFAHMRLDDANGVPRVRFRLDAKIDADGEIDDVLSYVLDVDAEGQPLTKQPVPRSDRNNIHVHYLPARRDPSDHIVYTANSLLGRALRSVNWQTERATIKELTGQISNSLAGNDALESLGIKLSELWHSLHKGSFFADPQVTFVSSEIEALLKHLSVSFSPAHGEELVDFSRLSDGQKSMLYLSLVLSIQGIGRAVLRAEDDSFDVEKLKPAVFTMVAMEEPENSLSPHYLGRVVQALRDLGKQDDAQALIATHSPSMLKRVKPESIRHMRLDGLRQTKVSTIVMPKKSTEAHKFVREAVQAFPELYFSRLVVLGEGDSEEIVLPRLLKAKGLATDEAAVSVVPLGGRHVNHFWRLLSALDIPFVTLLDLDLARHNGGWGRIRYAVGQLIKFPPKGCTLNDANLDSLPKWNDVDDLIDEDGNGVWITFLESQGVFFSSPMDLDFALLKKFPTAYNIDSDDLNIPGENKVKAVLGDSYHNFNLYTDDEKQLFTSYHKTFKLGSKPSAHLEALASLGDDELVANMPASFNRLVDAVIVKLEGLPE
ncbi:MAG: AAA family ATPase [Proteobacteria bacterium]|nr:AAA family ATPase [Desulfobulbaceae bacterium]MBU4151593.1 AAA family ATPase [Pseudomonadota bacterium]